MEERRYLRIIKENERLDVLNILKICFSNDLFFEEIKRENKWETLLPFVDYSIANRNSYGFYIDEALAGILLSADYFALKQYRKIYEIAFIKSGDSIPFIDDIEEMISKLSGKVKYIIDLCVLPQYQHQGIAGKLIDFYSNKSKGYDFAVDISNTESLNLYKKRDFDIKRINNEYHLAWKLNFKD